MTETLVVGGAVRVPIGATVGFRVREDLLVGELVGWLEGIEEGINSSS